MIFDTLNTPRQDSLMEVGRMFRADQRSDKIDLGLGTYRDNDGCVPVMATVKEAERRLQKGQETKAYLGAAGDALFCGLLRDTIFPDLASQRDGRLCAIQAPGGTGALRLGMELLARTRPDFAVLIGTPTWPNHLPLLNATGLHPITYRHYDPETGYVDFEAMCGAITHAHRGDLILLHGCCHNPTGADLTPHQWCMVADLLNHHGIVPIIDMAYAGMAEGIEEDAGGVRMLLDAIPEALVALSCSKNFALYRERTGMLLVQTASANAAAAASAHAQVSARSLWSNPPAHGSSIVATILEDPDLRIRWRVEVEDMRKRVRGRRTQLAASDASIDLSFLVSHNGLFALLPLDTTRIHQLRDNHAVYIDDTGRINIAGLNDSNIDRFLSALRS